ncbi:MFS transporter [Pseudacidobacterium ailaaui]|jgi:fucose permease|uniref:MFS transporter n=1 Tax=Pseudacidobacterium ailaaui TaxID=1382359 RepID=UPI00047D0AF7|nr:MFS transporter [Pseudacidobacterium ailaaui]MDI3254883.1 MFS transporter [Bacillota bacterium]
MSQKPSTLLLVALYCGFALTGVGTTLLGCALPSLAAAWRLNDSTSGLLFAAQFVGSSTGALLVRSPLEKCVLRGYLWMVIFGSLIALSPGHLAPLFFIGFGLGLGQAMTATSMVFGRIYSTRRGASQSLLNATWGLGAVICPWIASCWARLWPSHWLFLALALAALFPLLSLASHRPLLAACAQALQDASYPSAHLSLLLPLALFAFLYVGVESSVSGWMMTYMHRQPLSAEILAPFVTSLFWIALLCGRTAAPVFLKKISEPHLLTISLVLAIAGTGMLLLSRGSISSLASATWIGFSLAPVFPLCISRLLGITDNPAQSRWVFAISGTGGAALPWLTGQLAAWQNSLRIGLLVPLLGTGVMLWLHLYTRPRP